LEQRKSECQYSKGDLSAIQKQKETKCSLSTVIEQENGRSREWRSDKELDPTHSVRGSPRRGAI